MGGRHIDVDGSAVAAAWREAAADLGVTFEEGGLLETDGQGYPYLGIVVGFGSARGMLLFADDRDLWDRGRAAREQGYGWSVLSTSYEHYDRAWFVETLDDWGWCGEGAPPAWYTGRPWSEG